MAGDPTAPISSVTREESDIAVVGSPTRSKPEPVTERVRERGEKVGRYVVLDTIGRGGMGVVYIAWDPQLDRRIALKLVALAGEGDVEIETQRGRLLREAQALARLEHPHVVKVHDVGVCDEQVFIAMEYVEGENLRDWLRARRRSVGAIVEVFRAAARGLAAAHAAELVHRDFKPDNVLVGEAGTVKVVDFGLAREAANDGTPRSRHWAQTEPKFAAALEAAVAEGMASASDSGGHAADSGVFESQPSAGPQRSLLRGSTGLLTVAGTILGTPAYMAPEQHRGQPVDARSDQYAFCIALWEAVYGKRPFSGSDPRVLAERKRGFQLRESTRGIPVPRWLRTLLMRGLAADPSLRFADMTELIATIDRETERRRSSNRPWVVVLVIAVVIGLVASLAARDDQPGLCAPPIDRLVGVWDPPRRLEIEHALLASEAVYADDTWARVREGLDDYREAWLAAMVSACEAVHVEHVQSPEWLEQRLACLEDRRRELVSLTAQLARSDARTVENAARAARSLSPIDACSRELGDDERMPMPGDPHERLRIERQLDLLADAKAELAAGHLDEGLDAADEVLVRAREIGWAPLEAEALLVIGDRITDRERDPAKERATLHAAARAGLRGEHWVLAVQAWARLARGLARRGEVDEAKRWLDHATNLAGDLGTAGESPRLQAELANARSQWHFRSGRYVEAEAEARRREDLVAEWYGPESPQAADSLNSLGVAVYMQYRKDEAAEYYGQALAIIERISGPDHPSVATMHNNIGVVLTDKGRWPEALVHYQRALAIRRAVYPFGHELLMQSQLNLANFYLLSDSPQGGVAIATEFLAVVASLTDERLDQASQAGAGADELAAIRVDLIPYALLLGRMLERSGDHRSGQAILAAALDLVDSAPDSRLPPDFVFIPNDKHRPAHLEGCRFDIASELEHSATALHSTTLAERARSTLDASPMTAEYMQRCSDEVNAWAEARALRR